MADTAFQTQYRQEFIAAFEYGESRLRSATITDSVVKGNEATFLVAGTGGAEAVTRGVNGMIPARPDDLTQYTATLLEWHDKPRRTNFNIFASQGDGRRIMQMGTVKVMNRKIDSDIITQLDTATVTAGAAATASLNMVAKAKAILGNAEVDVTDADNMFGLITPAFDAYLIQTKEYASADYVEVKPFAGPAKKYMRWMGVNWIVHPRLTGGGTSSESCFLFHRDAIGHAVNTGGMDVSAGYNDEDDYYWARSSIFMGSKLLQNSGVVKMLHDGSAYTGS
jgi:hypothetical protein